MKKLFLLASSICLVAIGLLAQQCPTNLPYTPLGYGCFSNVLCTSFTNTRYSSIWPAFIELEAPSGNPSITLRRTGIGGTDTNRAIIAVSAVTNYPNTLLVSDNLRVLGNIEATGNVYGTSNILWQTNVVFATNAWFATNAPDTSLIVSSNVLSSALADTNLYKLAQSYYPTNQSVNVGGTNVITDMTIPYADVYWVTNMYMGRCTNLSTTNYQTAVRMLHGGPATGVDIGFDSLTTVVGTARLTNYTIITFFWNPATSVTNALCAPMY